MEVGYGSLGIFLLMALSIGVVPLVCGRLLGPHRPNTPKKATYECGFSPFGDARIPLDVRFYRVALLFILFDIEMVFLLPWAVHFRTLSHQALAIMGVFLALLLIGLVYEWKKGALEWD